MLRFTKATRETGVDGHFYPDNPRVTVAPGELPKPIYPENPLFWDEFSDTIEAVCRAHDESVMKRGVARGLERRVRNAKQAAELVHNDWPSDILTYAVKALRVPVFRDLGAKGVFTDNVVLLNHLMGWAGHAVSPNSFCAKWHFMMPRPEEVAGAIARDELEAPTEISMRLYDTVPRDTLVADQRKFTVYPEGCPNHPSLNAMHSAAAAAVATVVKVLMELGDEQQAEVDMSAYNMAFFRTTAGVHYPQDNRSGLWLGQTTMQRLLPGKLREVIGTPVEVTNQILTEVAVDWAAVR